MRIMILGAAGMIGRKLALRLAETGRLGPATIASLLLIDRTEPAAIAASFAVVTRAADIVDPDALVGLAGWRPDVVFHLAAIVSGEAEAEFERGYGVNLDATRGLLDALKAADCRPRLIFSSSLAVYGAPLPEIVPDDFNLTPRSSYGAQKAMGELLVADYSRKGYVDGISLRLPTIVVRPGGPNRAASGFLSGIIREPLNGVRALLPVKRQLRTWIASPAVAVDSLIHAATLTAEQTASTRALTGRGISVTVDEMIDALRAVAGPTVAARIHDEPDETIERIVASWPQAFTAEAAQRLGFPVDKDMKAMIEAYIADEIGGRIAA